jgi:hypothetical protein
LKNWQKYAVIVTIVLFLISGAVTTYVWMWNQRPIIDFNICGIDGSPLQTNYQIYDGSLPIYVAIDNRGDIDASICLIITVDNANITSSDPSGLDYNSNQATLNLAVQSHSPKGYVTINIMPIGNPKNFTVSVQAIDTHDWSFPTGFIDHIGGVEWHDYTTQATYTESNTDVYLLNS